MVKGFTKDHKFIPMTDYKKVTRKSRDQKEKTQGVRMKKTNVSSIKAGGRCFCGRTSVKGGLCPSCRDSGVFFEKQQIEQAQRNPKNVGSMQRNARDATDTSILNDLVNDFNRKSSTKIEYGNIGGQAKGLKLVGAGRFIAEAMTKKEASNCLRFTMWIMDRHMESGR